MLRCKILIHIGVAQHLAQSGGIPPLPGEQHNQTANQPGWPNHRDIGAGLPQGKDGSRICN